MKCRWSIALLFLFATNFLMAQLRSESLGFFKKAEEPNPTRIYTVAGGEALVFTASYVGLYHLWYKEYHTGDFHFHDDFNNWQQVDKAGHAFSAYYLGYAAMEVNQWAGIAHKKSLLTGGSLGFLFLTGIELMDGYSEGWGFSWGDMAANTLGTGLLIGQELLWKDQRIVMKYSYHPTDYAAENPSLLGDNWQQQIFKDYNGQTYWLSANVHSLSGWDRWPAWLNLAAGYGADGMLTARYDADFYSTRPDVNWQRQYYLSLDVDLRKIPVKSHFLKALFKTLNVIKIPMPTLEFNEQEGVRFHPLYF